MSKKRKSKGSTEDSPAIAPDYSILPRRLNYNGCRLLACAVVRDVVLEWYEAKAYGNTHAAESCEVFLKGYAYKFYRDMVPDRLPDNIMRYLEAHPDGPPKQIISYNTMN